MVSICGGSTKESKRGGHLKKGAEHYIANTRWLGEEGNSVIEGSGVGSDIGCASGSATAAAESFVHAVSSIADGAQVESAVEEAAGSGSVVDGGVGMSAGGASTSDRGDAGTVLQFASSACSSEATFGTDSLAVKVRGINDSSPEGELPSSSEARSSTAPKDSSASLSLQAVDDSSLGCGSRFATSRGGLQPPRATVLKVRGLNDSSSNDEI